MGEVAATTRAVASRVAVSRVVSAEVLVPVGAGLLLLTVGAKYGGYFPTVWGWTGTVLAWGAVIALLLAAPRLRPLEVVTLAALAGYVGWIALTRFWSEAPGHTISEVQRDLMYPLALLVALVLLRRSTVTTFVGAVAVAIDALALYGLLTRLFPERLGTFDSVAAYRLSAPVGYWNTLGILTAMGIVLTLGFAARGRPVTRALAAAALVGLAPTLYFTFSRGSIAALALGLAALVVVDTRRLQLSVAALVFLPLPFLATWIATRYDALTTTAAALTDATRDGHRLAVILLLLAAVAVVLAIALTVAERLYVPGVWVRRGYAAAVCAAATAVVVGIVGHFGGPVHMVQSGWESFRGPPVGINKPGRNLTRRFTSLSSNGRITLWTAAWEDWKRNPIAGAGAGSFEWYWAQHQETDSKARDAHGLYAETLAEMGVVGLVLVVVALLLPFGGILRARRRDLIPFAAAAYVAFVAHLGVDWDWEMPVVVFAGLLCAAALLVAARRDDTPVALRPWAQYGGVAVVAAVGVFAFASMIGTNAVAASREAVLQGNLDKGIAEARKATAWIPWSAEPWKALGDAQRDAGDRRAARRSYREAIEREPLDFDAWLGVGNVSQGPTSRRAYATARRLYPFNRMNPPPGGR